MMRTPHPASAHVDPTAPRTEFTIGRLRVGPVTDPGAMQQVQALRQMRFRGRRDGSDLDRFDPLCRHLLVRDGTSGQGVAAARLRPLADAATMAASYTGQFFALGHLATRRLLEIGRICIADTARQDPDVARALLAGLTRQAMVLRADMLVGCASFSGADPQRHAPALAYLAAHHIGPEALRPPRRDPAAVALGQQGARATRRGLRAVPPLLRMYLGMGGWVSDHAVRDPDLDTLILFTAVETARIPPGRLRALQALALG